MRALARAAPACLVLAVGCTEPVALVFVPDAGGDTGERADSARERSGIDRAERAPENDALQGSCTIVRIDALSFTRQLPEVIIALDRSSSMHQSRLGEVSRTQAVQRQIRPLLQRYQAAIRFGYEEFPSRRCASGPCCASDVLVPPALQTAFAIDRRMRCESAPECSEAPADAPTWAALERCREWYALSRGDDRPRYVLLMTDGTPACPGEPVACQRTVAEASRLATSDVKTAVVGLGEEVDDNTCLEEVAIAGQARPPGGGAQVSVRDEAQLESELEDIVSGIANHACRITLRGALPSNRQQVLLTLLGIVIPFDADQRDGWSYDPPDQSVHIAVHGSWCERLQSGVPLLVWSSCVRCGTDPSCH